MLLFWLTIKPDIDGSRGYGMKTNDEMIQVVKQWYSYIANLLAKHKLVVFVRDNARENKSRDIKDFF
jgi:hypothetical protein